MKMDQNFIDTLYLFVCGARGICPEITQTLKLDKIYEISKKQAIWETVFLSIKKLYELNKIDISSDMFEKLESEFVHKCARQYMKNDYVHNLINRLEQICANPCILKGESVARFYNTPIARISGDYDILIDPKKLDDVSKIMRDMGFNVPLKGTESHHIECTHSGVGLVEIHVDIYGERTKVACFNNSVEYNEEYISLTAEDGTTYKTLGITDGFIFLFLHFLKHFISEGAGVRQLMDVLLYIENNINEIDWDTAKKTLDTLGFYHFFECIIEIGKKYLNFPKGHFADKAVDEASIEKIFNDMQKGGVFGHDDEQRQGFYEIYLTERYKKIAGKSYKAYTYQSKLSRLFPNREFMATNYPFVKKSALLLPVAWVCRLFKGVLHAKSNKHDLSLDKENRMNLMRELGLL